MLILWIFRFQMKIVEDDPRDEDGGKHADHDADGQRHGESLDRPGPEAEEEQRRDEGGHVGVEDGQEGLRVAGLDGRPRRLSQPELLP